VRAGLSWFWVARQFNRAGGLLLPEHGNLVVMAMVPHVAGLAIVNITRRNSGGSTAKDIAARYPLPTIALSASIGDQVTLARQVILGDLQSLPNRVQVHAEGLGGRA